MFDRNDWVLVLTSRETRERIKSLAGMEDRKMWEIVNIAIDNYPRSYENKVKKKTRPKSHSKTLFLLQPY
jgi:hypothetical protein